jgi:uncharacterized membrane protein
MFFVGTAGVMFGGPIAVAIIGTSMKNVVEPDETFKGLACVAGSWIGGGANFAAMQSLFDPSPADVALATAVDVVCANVWLAVLFLMIGKRDRVNAFMQADASPVDDLIKRVEFLEKTQVRSPSIACMHPCAGACNSFNVMGSRVHSFYASFVMLHVFLEQESNQI